MVDEDAPPDGMSTGPDGMATSALVTVVGPRRVYPPEPGDPIAIGPYTVLCRLPRGGQGADVFVARPTDDAAGPLVVIKCLPADAGELG